MEKRLGTVSDAEAEIAYTLSNGDDPQSHYLKLALNEIHYLKSKGSGSPSGRLTTICDYARKNCIEYRESPIEAPEQWLIRGFEKLNNDNLRLRGSIQALQNKCCPTCLADLDNLGECPECKENDQKLEEANRLLFNWFEANEAQLDASLSGEDWSTWVMETRNAIQQYVEKTNNETFENQFKKILSTHWCTAVDQLIKLAQKADSELNTARKWSRQMETERASMRRERDAIERKLVKEKREWQKRATLAEELLDKLSEITDHPELCVGNECKCGYNDFIGKIDTHFKIYRDNLTLEVESSHFVKGRGDIVVLKENLPELSPGHKVRLSDREGIWCVMAIEKSSTGLKTSVVVTQLTE